VNYSEKLKAPLLKPRIAGALDLINPHLYSVEERIRGQARAFDPALEGYIAYVCDTKGKRLRPALALLSGGATGGITPGHIDLAVILELIHVATLVHDDIIDGAELRRAQPTANARWGSAISVLLGDCLFAHALKLASNFHNSEISRRIADAATEVCSGEILQTQRRFDLSLSIPDYLRIIEMKTAALFAAASELGAFLSEASPELITGMKTFGCRLGTAYQIYDDLVDIAGEEQDAGKTLGTDLAKGKLTLPILLLLQNSGSSEQARLHGLILAGKPEAARALAEEARASGVLRKCAGTATRLVREGTDQLDLLPSNRHREALRSIADYLLGHLEAFQSGPN